jgi:protein-S-isoprenylcysteine O-methyltransferase Ste14
VDIRLKVFEMRSYTPIPFILVMVIWAHPTVQTLVLGFLLALLGESIRFWGVSICGSETRTTGSVGATNLITDGPFGHVRNPLYVGNILIYLGIGIMSNTMFPWLQIGALMFFIIQYQLIVSREEEHLTEAFGDEYKAYLVNVPRFLPRVTRYVGEHSFHRTPDFGRGIKSETRTLQAFTIVILLVLVRYFVR